MICAAGLIAIVPIMVVYLFFQRNFIEGLTSGSVKG
jgi:raffinose/stachyose/melibiose transport system permease protein